MEKGERCPCCDQFLPIPVSSSATALLEAMRRNGPRDVYRITYTNLWTLTFGAGQNEPPCYEQRIVEELAASHRIVPTYPDCKDCYSLPPA
jgi:hypothetical protein